jgi:kynurenine formamidase
LRRLNVTPGPGWFILIRTGYDEKVGTPDWLNHPGIDEECADYLASLGVNGVGTDAPSIDHPPFPGHRKLLSRGVLIYENLTNLGKLLGRVFEFIGIPLRIEGGSGSPVRALAILE